MADEENTSIVEPESAPADQQPATTDEAANPIEQVTQVN